MICVHKQDDIYLLPLRVQMPLYGSSYVQTYLSLGLVLGLVLGLGLS